jgi:hypothetical protein
VVVEVDLKCDEHVLASCSLYYRLVLNILTPHILILWFPLCGARIAGGRGGAGLFQRACNRASLDRLDNMSHIQHWYWSSVVFVMMRELLYNDYWFRNSCCQYVFWQPAEHKIAVVFEVHVTFLRQRKHAHTLNLGPLN